MTPVFGFATIWREGKPVVGVVVDERWIPLASLVTGQGAPGTVPPTVSSLTEVWDPWVDWVGEQSLSPADGEWLPTADARFAPALTAPPTIYCAGANYTDHAQAMHPGAAFAPASPYHFIVSRQALAAHRQPVVRPPGCARLDWEIELALVIGRRAEAVPVERALDHVAGYTIANDISARDLAVRTDDQPFALDWLKGKSYATFLPLGPVVVPRRFVPDPQDLRLSLTVNGKTMQDSSTTRMVFSCAEQVAALSAVVPLVPGDVVCTGTPAGTGHESGSYLDAGDALVARVELLGELENMVVERAQRPSPAASGSARRQRQAPQAGEPP
jgi:2-keto-4-pentenoate hydratase/2-oxohepta-3-ene-1,7-dioic acid hydratase in catechol pathway